MVFYLCGDKLISAEPFPNADLVRVGVCIESQSTWLMMTAI
jgi:hypothetical protein